MSVRGSDLPIDPNLEQDSRFPSGKWVGFFTQPYGQKGRHEMELLLTFKQEVVQGEGRDYVGAFLIKGRYELESGKCHWNKSYVGKHDVFYQGYNEGKGIWGTWEIPPGFRGGFHVWPEFLGDPSLNRLSEEESTPLTLEVEEDEELLVGAGSGS